MVSNPEHLRYCFFLLHFSKNCEAISEPSSAPILHLFFFLSRRFKGNISPYISTERRGKCETLCAPYQLTCKHQSKEVKTDFHFIFLKSSKNCVSTLSLNGKAITFKLPLNISVSFDFKPAFVLVLMVCSTPGVGHPGSHTICLKLKSCAFCAISALLTKNKCLNSFFIHCYDEYFFWCCMVSLVAL